MKGYTNINQIWEYQSKMHVTSMGGTITPGVLSQECHLRKILVFTGDSRS